MENKNEKNNIREKVMEAIQSGKVKMKPRWRFVLNSSLFILGVFIILFLLLYLVSLMAFSVRQTGLDFAPGFGGRGWIYFLRYFPWLLILLCLIFLGILEVLVKKFAFAYKKPLLYSVLGIIVIVIGGGLAMAQTPLHGGLYGFARKNHLPLAEPFYRHFGMPNQVDDIHRGTVIEDIQGGFILQNPIGSTSTVLISSSTGLPFETEFSPGDRVIVFGEETTSGIRAFGIRKIMVLPLPPDDSN